MEGFRPNPNKLGLMSALIFSAACGAESPDTSNTRPTTPEQPSIFCPADVQQFLNNVQPDTVLCDWNQDGYNQISALCTSINDTSSVATGCEKTCNTGRQGKGGADIIKINQITVKDNTLSGQGRLLRNAGMIIDWGVGDTTCTKTSNLKADSEKKSEK